MDVHKDKTQFAARRAEIESLQRSIARMESDTLRDVTHVFVPEGMIVEEAAWEIAKRLGGARICEINVLAVGKLTEERPKPRGAPARRGCYFDLRVRVVPATTASRLELNRLYAQEARDANEFEASVMLQQTTAKRKWGPRARRLLEAVKQSRMAMGTSDWLRETGPAADLAMQAYLDGLYDRLGVGGLGAYLEDESGDAMLEAYIDQAKRAASMSPIGFRAGSVESRQEAERIILEQMEIMLNAGVRFGSTADLARFAAEMACSVFGAMSELPKQKEKPQAKAVRAKAYRTPRDATLNRNSLLDNFVVREKR